MLLTLRLVMFPDALDARTKFVLEEFYIFACECLEEH